MTKIFVALIVAALMISPVLYARWTVATALDELVELQLRDNRLCTTDEDKSPAMISFSESMCEGRDQREQCLWGNHDLGKQICAASDKIYDWHDLALISDDKRKAMLDVASAEFSVGIMCDKPYVLRSRLMHGLCMRAEDDLERAEKRSDIAGF